jgi:hypothetical protein|tara:strand:+ start:775 stop:963 length:189 start_codon:yes stop_codon:yes gene_type:complete
MDNINVNKINNMKDLEKKYGKKLIEFVIKVDALNPEEIKDIEYLEERIETHLEELDLSSFTN